MVKQLGKSVVIVDKRTHQKHVFDSVKQAERFVGCLIRALLRGSTKSSISKLYDAYFCSPNNTVERIVYKNRDCSSQFKPVNIVDNDGNIVYAAKSGVDAIHYLGLSKSFVIKTAVTKHHCIKGYYLQYP